VLFRSVPASKAAEGPKAAEVDAAIARGVGFLKGEQAESGEWTYRFNLSHTLGITALAGLALLENGVPATDPAIVNADRVVRNLSRRSFQTYDLSLAILFLSRARQGQTEERDALIQRLAGRLAGGGVDGFWSYTVPVEDA